MTITDLAYTIDNENVFDLVIENGDFATTGGFDSLLVASLFSDRRAFDDEGIDDPLRRRGWAGSAIIGGTDDPDFNFGSGLWFYEQARASRETVLGVRAECEAALAWFIDEGLAETAIADVVASPDLRTLDLLIDVTTSTGAKEHLHASIALATEAIILRAY